MKNRICYRVTVIDTEPATKAHIHKGSADQAGGVVKALKAPTDGTSSGCVKMSRKQIMMINRNPQGFYVNVHSQEHSAVPSGVSSK